MAKRLAHHVAVLGAEAQSALELQAILQQHAGLARFVVASQSCSPALDPGEYELLILDADGQVGQRLAFLTRCRGLYPHLPVIVLVEHGDTSTAVAAMKAGAADCLEKPLVPGRLWSAVTAALGHGPSSAPQVHKTLTKTELRVLHLLLAGRTNLEIAEQFHRSRRTIEAHRRNIMRKLDASRVSDLVKQAFRMQLIPREAADGAMPR
jgi:DNA-binding NarL/FixJ family response regulator